MADLHRLVKLSPMLSAVSSKSILCKVAYLILVSFSVGSASCQNSGPVVSQWESSTEGMTPTSLMLPTMISPVTPISTEKESSTDFGPTKELGSTPLIAPSPAIIQSVDESELAQTAAGLPIPTPDVYAPYTIEALSSRNYGGGQLEIVETLGISESFTRYLITYPSDGLTIYGFMNVPNDGSIFPIAILVHGYITPSEYSTIAYTTRYADDLARSGYFVIHPNLRNHGPSDQGPDEFRVGYAIDILNLIAVLKEQSRDPVGYLRRADASDINLWGHSMGGGIVLRTITVNNDPAIRSAVLYGSMSGDETLNFERILFWSNGIDGQFEIEAPGAVLEAISPIFHLERIQAPISIHHSDSDDQVPPEWSADLCQKLLAINHPTECFSYAGLPHTFRGQGDALFMDRVTDFFNRH